MSFSEWISRGPVSFSGCLWKRNIFREQGTVMLVKIIWARLYSTYIHSCDKTSFETKAFRGRTFDNGGPLVSLVAAPVSIQGRRSWHRWLCRCGCRRQLWWRRWGGGCCGAREVEGGNSMSCDESIGKHFVGVIGDSEEDVSGLWKLCRWFRLIKGSFSLSFLQSPASYSGVQPWIRSLLWCTASDRVLALVYSLRQGPCCSVQPWTGSLLWHTASDRVLALVYSLGQGPCSSIQ
jgi:hypothetical protein